MSVLYIKDASGNWQAVTAFEGPPGAPGEAGQKGVTFRPTVSSSGVISWTNDGGLTNPSAVSIMGPRGPEGPAGPTGPQGPAPDTSIFLTRADYEEGFDGGTIA